MHMAQVSSQHDCILPWPHLSVVGSGPIRIPGKSDSRRYLMKVVLPVEYCPTSMTIGRASKSASSRTGEWKSWNWYSFSSGSSFCLRKGDNLA